MNKSIKPDFSQMARRWPSSHVVRHKVDVFSGGIVGPKYLANLDSQGKGPPGRIRIGRQIAYPVSDFIEWLESRAEVVVGKRQLDLKSA